MLASAFRVQREQAAGSSLGCEVMVYASQSLRSVTSLPTYRSIAVPFWVLTIKLANQKKELEWKLKVSVAFRLWLLEGRDSAFRVLGRSCLDPSVVFAVIRNPGAIAEP